MAAFWIVCSLICLSPQMGFGSRRNIDETQRVKYDVLNHNVKTLQENQCKTMHKQLLYMPEDTISHIPRYNTLKTKTWSQNRSSLIHLHNMALNRAFFYSFIFQKFNRSFDFQFNPDWRYYYMSATADVHANDNFINGSAVVFDSQCSYPNWFSSLPFNYTLPLFAPKAYKSNEADIWRDESTMSEVTVKDLGAMGSRNNYTDPRYRVNPWYNLWLPDTPGNRDNKFSYSVGIKNSERTGHFTTADYQTTRFYGPPIPGQNNHDGPLPVLFTRPYFDCGQSNKWVVSATSPVVDFMVRYNGWTQFRRPRFVAVVVMSIDFERIDFNPCPLSEGNPPPNFLSGTDKCKPNSTCKPVPGYGFRRGGYTCECDQGYTYPVGAQGPYHGDEMEQATEEEFSSGFNCVPIDSNPISPTVDNVDLFRVKREAEECENCAMKSDSDKTSQIRMVYDDVAEAKDQSKQKTREKRSSSFNARNIGRLEASITAANCAGRTSAELYLPENVPFGGVEQFEAEARTALRLAHFLSNYLQNVVPGEIQGDFYRAIPLQESQLFGEVISNVMANYKIVSSGIFFDAFTFQNFDRSGYREFFGPYAWRTQDGTYLAHDAAGLTSQYINMDWFQEMKQRWTNTSVLTLKQFTMNSFVRPYFAATSNSELPPAEYRAASLEHGRWTRPRFQCDGQIDDWVMTYVVPFFGKDQLRQNLQFKGVVTVDVLLSGLSDH